MIKTHQNGSVNEERWETKRNSNICSIVQNPLSLAISFNDYDDVVEEGIAFFIHFTTLLIALIDVVCGWNVMNFN